MPRLPVLTREELDEEGKRVWDHAKATTGRVGGGPSIAYAFAPGMWEASNAASAYLDRCSLSPQQVRIAAMVTVRHYDAPFPWAAQARAGLAAGVDRAAVDAINNRRKPSFASREDEAVYAAAKELVETGSLGDASFKAGVEALGHQRLVDVAGVVGHFCKTAMMANLAGAEVPADAPSTLAG